MTMSRTITLNSPAMPLLLGEPALVLMRLEGEEAFSTVYTYTLTVKTPANPQIPWQTASNVDLKALIGKEMTIEIELDGNGLDAIRGLGKGQREISGLVEKARYIGRDANQAMFEIVIRPWLYLTKLTSDFKIFQNKTAVDIIEEVLSEYHFSFEKRLTATYPQLDFQVQYGETDFDFIERLMEEWGIYWFFEHQDQKHKLVMVDHVGAHKPYSSEAYRVIEYAPDTPKAGAEYIAQLHHQEMLTSGRWVTNDYDFTKSRADILALDVKPRKTSFNELELYHWPGDYDQPGTGEQLARVRIEERGALGSRAIGSGELRGIVCGTNFELQGYPLEKVNREYMVISSHLTIQEVDQLSHEEQFSVQCQFTVQPTSKIYRHPQTITKPRTHGPQNAIVVGPSGEDIWTDEYGRVKVRFVWDRYGKNNEADSCWLRVSQAWAGNSFGGIYIPRIGHEVIVDFINGDPDRPLIIGSLYNNVTLPPWELPVNATQSGLISRTVGGGKSNYNGLRFEDKPGLEQYWEQAERDMDRLTKNNETQTIGVNADLSIGNNRSVAVGTNYTKNVGSNSSYSIGSNSDLNIGSNRSVVVGANYSKSISGVCSKMIGGSSSFQVGSTHSTVIAAANSLSVGAINSTNVGGANFINVGGYQANCVGGAWQVTVGGAATIVGGGAVAISAGGELLLTGSIVKIIGKEKVIIQGGQVQINPGDGGGAGGGGGGGLSGLAGLAGLGGLIAPRSIMGGLGLKMPLETLPIHPPEPSAQPPMETPVPTSTGTPVPTPTPEVTPTPTPEVTPTPTPEVTPTPTPEVTPTPTPEVTPTPTPEVTPTPTPEVTPTPTPEVTPTPTPEVTPTPTPEVTPTPTPEVTPTPTPEVTPTPTPEVTPTPTPEVTPTPTPEVTPTPTPEVTPTPTPEVTPTPTPEVTPTPTPEVTPTPTPEVTPTPTPEVTPTPTPEVTPTPSPTPEDTPEP